MPYQDFTCLISALPEKWFWNQFDLTGYGVNQPLREDAKARTHKSNYVGFSGYLIRPEKKKKNRSKAASYEQYNTLCSDSLPDLFRSAMREMLDAEEEIWLNIFG